MLKTIRTNGMKKIRKMTKKIKMMMTRIKKIREKTIKAKTIKIITTIKRIIPKTINKKKMIKMERKISQITKIIGDTKIKIDMGINLC